MPTINFQGTQLSKEQKKELIQKFTEVTREVTHAPDPYITVIIEEYSDDNIGIGGKMVAEVREEIKKQKQ